MPFNISNFVSQIGENGYLQPNKFQTVIVPPPMFTGQSIITALNSTGVSISDISDELKFRTEDIIIPAISVNTMDVYRYGIGTTQKQPVSATFNTFSLTFISDGYGELWNFWYQWLNNVFGFSPTNNGQNGTINQLPTLSANYKSDYSTDITIFVYDEFGNIVQTYYFNQAYPISLNDIRLNWGLTDQILKISVDLTFTNYLINGSAVSGLNFSNS